VLIDNSPKKLRFSASHSNVGGRNSVGVSTSNWLDDLSDELIHLFRRSPHELACVERGRQIDLRKRWIARKSCEQIVSAAFFLNDAARGDAVLSNTFV
jgi:hypothetical protein